jgi:hypothetical protein
MPDWHALFGDYAAAVDWPTTGFWPELMEAFPDALVLLSVRDADAWWTSAHATIFSESLRAGMSESPVGALIGPLMATRFTAALDDRETCIAAFERHNTAVRSRVPASRLLEWRPEHGWAPICAALDLPIPDEPFPRVNTTADFKEMATQPNPFSAEP